MGGLQRTGRLVHAWRTSRRGFKASGSGFTIVEVLIVLAVTGALFIAAAILISGKQSQAAFNQAIQQIQSQIQQVQNEEASGYFPNAGGFQCTAGNGGPVVLTDIAPNTQGANAGCIFAGKAMQFQVAGTDPEQFATYTIAAAQKNSSGQEATSLATAAPTLVAPGTGSPAGFPDLTVTNILQNGLATTPAPSSGHSRMWYNNGGPDVDIGAFAFVSSLASYASGTITSGSQHLSVLAVDGTTLGMSKAAAVDAMNAGMAGGVVDPSNGVFICFASGGTNESGLVTIGGNGHPLSVTLKIMDGTTTCGK